MGLELSSHKRAAKSGYRNPAIQDVILNGGAAGGRDPTSAEHFDVVGGKYSGECVRGDPVGSSATAMS